MRDGTKVAGPGGLTWLFGFVALAAVVALVVVGAHSLDRAELAERPAGDRSDAAAHEMQALTQEIAALRADLAQLRLGLTGATPGADPTPLAPSPVDPAALQPLVDALDRVAAQLGARVPGITAPARNAERREELRELLDPQVELSDEEAEAWRIEFERRKDRYLFLTEQHVLDTYGRPDAAHTRDDGSWTWEYHFGEYSGVTFKLANGRVIDAWSE